MLAKIGQGNLAALRRTKFNFCVLVVGLGNEQQVYSRRLIATRASALYCFGALNDPLGQAPRRRGTPQLCPSSPPPGHPRPQFRPGSADRPPKSSQSLLSVRASASLAA